MKPLIWAIELHDTLAIAVTRDQSMPVLLLLLPLLQFIGLSDNPSGATSTPTSQAASMNPLPSLQTSAAEWTNGAAYPVGGR
jgi:hypothetical protein